VTIYSRFTQESNHVCSILVPQLLLAVTVINKSTNGIVSPRLTRTPSPQGFSSVSPLFTSYSTLSPRIGAGGGGSLRVVETHSISALRRLRLEVISRIEPSLESWGEGEVYSSERSTFPQSELWNTFFTDVDHFRLKWNLFRNLVINKIFERTF
jgi:hypothetical protein